MKKYFLLSLLSLMVMTFFVSCDNTTSNPATTDNDTFSVAYDIKNVNFAYNATDGYTILRTFNNALYATDVVLVYRQSGVTTNNAPVWQQIPRTLYLGTNGQNELDYDFDFSKFDVLLKAGGNYDISTTPTYINGQTFRVVIVPASGKNANVDYSDYNSVKNFFHIDESKVKTL